MKKAIFYLFTSILCLAACDELTGGADELLNLKSDSEIEVGAAGTSVQILFEAQGTWSAESDSDWAVPAQEYGDEGDISLDVTVYPNETGSERTAVIILACGDQSVETRIVQSADENGGGDVPEPQGEYLVEYITETDQFGHVSVFTYKYGFIESFGKYMPVSENLTVDGEDYGTAMWEYHPEYIDRILMYEGEEDYRYRISLDSGNRLTDISDEEYPGSYTIEYDSEDRLVSEFSGDLQASYYSVKYDWENGNLVKSTRRDVQKGGDLNGDGYINEDDVYDETEESVYTYTEYPNNTNLDLNARLCDSYNSAVMSEGPGLFGFTGMRSANLGYSSHFEDSIESSLEHNPGKVYKGQTDKINFSRENVDDSAIEASFTFNDKGYPTKIVFTAPLMKTDIVRTVTYEINENGYSEVIDGVRYYYIFTPVYSDHAGEPYPAGTATYTYDITYTVK